MKIYNKITGELIIGIKDNMNQCYLDFNGAVLHDANFCGVDLRGADFSGAVLCGADFRGADLRGADFSGAVLCGADFRGAVLCGADFSGAVLCGADFRGAVLCGVKMDKEIIFFNFNKHVLQKIDDEIRIGCEAHSIQYWLENYVEIGKENYYTDEEIRRYGNFIKKLED
jgi:hypothetical protein